MDFSATLNSMTEVFGHVLSSDEMNLRQFTACDVNKMAFLWLLAGQTVTTNTRILPRGLLPL